MNVTKTELMRIAELCWAASMEAKISTPEADGLVSAMMGGINSVRLGTYNIMLQCLLPKSPIHNTVDGTTRIAKDKEEWEA